MIGLIEVQLFEIFSEDNDRVTDEEMSEVCCEEGVHATVHELLFDVWIEDQVGVEILFPESVVFRDVS